MGAWGCFACCSWTPDVALSRNSIELTRVSSLLHYIPTEPSMVAPPIYICWASHCAVRPQPQPPLSSLFILPPASQTGSCAVHIVSVNRAASSKRVRCLPFGGTIAPPCSLYINSSRRLSNTTSWFCQRWPSSLWNC